MQQTIFAKHINVLKKCVLFKGIDLDEYQYIINCLSPVITEYKTGSTISLEGDICPGTCIILSGQVSIVKILPAGESNILHILEPGDIFGEMSTFSKNRKWPASAIAKADCEVMTIPAEKFIHTCKNQCNSHTRLTENMLVVISDKALMLNKKMSYILLKSLRNKICAYLLDQQASAGSKTFILPMSRNELADFLNVTRPSLSRELSKMKDEGIIDFHRSAIKILKPEILAKEALI